MFFTNLYNRIKNCLNNTIELKLMNIISDDLELYSLNNFVTLGKVVEIYDGDTCKIVLNVNGTLHKYNCRLNQIDTPEMKPLLTKPNRANEIINAYRARNRLTQLVTNCNCEIDKIITNTEWQELINKNKKIIKVRCHEFDKYGRLLVTLYEESSKESVNQTLINELFAYEYDGGKKK